MVSVPQVVYTHASGQSVDIFSKNAKIRYQNPGKEIVRQVNKVGIVVDPNQGYRVVTCSAKIPYADYVKLRDYYLPAVAPTYDATYPNVTVRLKGDTVETILCVLMDMQKVFVPQDRWAVALRFEERSDPT